MEMKLKHRIVGIMVLAAVAIIVLAFVSSGSKQTKQTQHDQFSTRIPTPPAKPKTVMNIPIVAKHTAQVYVGGASKPEATVDKIEPVVRSKAKPAPKKAKEITVKKPVVKKSEPIASKSTIKKGWTVQVASFGSRSNAEKLQQRLRKNGFQAYVRTAKLTNGKTITRVFVGPMLQKNKAQQKLSKLRNRLGLKGVVVKYQV